MKRIFRASAIVLVAILTIASHTYMRGENVTRKEAQKIAETFFNANYGEYVASPKLAWNGKQLTTDKLFSPFYVFNHPKGGFVMIASDNKAYPILAYSRNKSFDLDKVGDDERELFSQFAHEIEIIRYDDRWPGRAVEAWGDINRYIAKILEHPYDTPEYRQLSEKSRERIEEMDRRNSWIVMPTAVEYPVYDPENYRGYRLDDVLTTDEGIEVEEAPFSFYENFIREIRQEEEARLAALDEIVSPTEPIVKHLGGAHYIIELPENARLLRVYTIDGTRKVESYYHDTRAVSLDLSSLSTGYYVMMILGEEGHVYGFKIAR